MWAGARVLGGVTILGAIGWRLGTGPFLDGLRAVGPRSIALAVSITCATTTACAYRWHVVARGLGVGLPLPHAIAAYYRSQFLNTVLPGGIVGDVHRGVITAVVREVSAADCAWSRGNASQDRSRSWPPP